MGKKIWPEKQDCIMHVYTGLDNIAAGTKIVSGRFKGE